MAKAYIGLGSNLGDRNLYLDFAIENLDSLSSVSVVKVSSVVETPPLSGGPTQGNYLNQVLCIETSLKPYELLKEIQTIENEGGRLREVRWGPRTIDIDILIYENVVINEKELVVPHPEIYNREFVMSPLVEIDSELRHPVTNKLILDMLLEYYQKNGQRELEVL